MKKEFNLIDSSSRRKSEWTISIIGLSPECVPYVSLYDGQRRLHLSKPDMRLLATNILKALDGKPRKRKK